MYRNIAIWTLFTIAVDITIADSLSLLYISLCSADHFVNVLIIPSRVDFLWGFQAPLQYVGEVRGVEAPPDG